MQQEKFVRQYLGEHKDLPEAWVQEIVLIAAGQTSLDSAKKRGVTRDAVKAQRKKIFKALGVEDGRELILNMFHVAVTKIK